MRQSGHALFDAAVERLQRKLPPVAGRLIDHLHEPRMRWLRIPLGVLFMAGGLVGFLPVVGFWMFPLGLLFLAQDVPFLRRPVAGFLGWLLDRWDAVSAWLARRRGRRGD